MTTTTLGPFAAGRPAEPKAHPPATAATVAAASAPSVAALRTRTSGILAVRDGARADRLPKLVPVRLSLLCFGTDDGLVRRARGEPGGHRPQDLRRPQPRRPRRVGPAGR